jgi:hypothetical protein
MQMQRFTGQKMAGETESNSLTIWNQKMLVATPILMRVKSSMESFNEG